ncbi:hypothetical protein PVAND_006292 [Polypedilum vanderplanki]|uniref:Uncharacterized protein n=1 Tax=Polypedilum vanderplanki TaxID=319348 RepID=A0A9J6C370_POLVA|nr:hypothetical protein PVAND_006292 [Polypedilum vanderplanki]
MKLLINVCGMCSLEIGGMLIGWFGFFANFIVACIFMILTFAPDLFCHEYQKFYTDDTFDKIIEICNEREEEKQRWPDLCLVSLHSSNCALLLKSFN